MKRIASLLLCLMLLGSLAVPVYAEETQPTEQETVHEHSWSETNTATCTQAGVLTRTCDCGETETSDAPAKGHDYGNWITTETSHSRECVSCLVTDNGQHLFKEEVSRKPTCKEDGYKTKTCTVCGYLETIVLTKLKTHTYDSACDGECNICGIKRDVQHSFTTTWSKDYNGHWYECTKCGEKKDMAKHIPGAAATEDADQVCTVCSYVLTAKKQHEHKYEKEWTTDESGHWHACTGKTCDSEQDYAAHSFDNDCDPDCAVCDYKRDNTHKYDTEGWNTTKFDHWNICAVCGQDSPKEKHTPGPEATDKSAQLCTVCGFEIAPVLGHEHDFGKTYSNTADSHWQECECGETSVPEPHVWDNGKENRGKTITYTCTRCGFEKTMDAPSSGFSWLTVILIILALMCVAGIVVLAIMLKRGRFEDETEEEELGEYFMEESPVSEQADPEEKAIDDFFASLDDEFFK